MFEAPMTVRIGELEFAVTCSGTRTKIDVTRPDPRGETIAHSRMTGDATTKQAKAALAAILTFVKESR